MILSVTLSKPVKNISSILGDDYVRVKIKRNVSSGAKADEAYLAEFFTEKQVFHKKFSEESLGEFLGRNAGISFKVCVERTEDSEIQILANKKGKISWLEKKIGKPNSDVGEVASAFKNIKMKTGSGSSNQTAEGKVIASKYDKFRQINRFLEFVDDILPDVTRIRTERDDSSPVRVVDFGSGKSYLTFAVHYFLTEGRKIDCEVFGLDLKKDVIEYCSKLSSELGLKNLNFAVGDISDYSGGKSPDIVVTLHACDTATDYALDYAVKYNVSAILSVPCCQHELNAQLSKSSAPKDSPFEPFLRYGLIKERFAALATDAIRAELLEKSGYKVQILDFIDSGNTPKNLLIRAVKSGNRECPAGFESLLSALSLNQTLRKLMGENED